MEIQITKEVEKHLVASVKRYCAEDLDLELGDLQASLFLRFCLREIGPSIYNQAIADAQAYFQEKVADLEDSCFAEEFAHWKDRPKSAAPRRAGFRP
jgi:uncharacterized protein (DUF2164 family)